MARVTVITNQESDNLARVTVISNNQSGLRKFGTCQGNNQSGIRQLMGIGWNLTSEIAGISVTVAKILQPLDYAFHT